MIDSSIHSSAEGYDVFLCHNSKDKPEVRQITEALKARGLKPWIDEDELRPGDPWPPAIEAALAAIGTAAVFVGKAGGRVQGLEIDTCIAQNLRTIPIILPGCIDDSEIRGFLRSKTWVDFRQADSDPLHQLCDAIREVEPPAQPVVAVAPTTTSDNRSQLIVYCQNAGLLVARAGIYPADTDSAAKAFVADLERCQIAVQLDESSSVEPSDEVVKRIATIVSEYPYPNRVMHWKPGGMTRSEFRKKVVARARRVFGATRPDPDMGPPGNEVAQKWVMVKYDRVDAQPTREMLGVLKNANIRCTSSPNGKTTLAQRMREHPFDALILVLGACDNDWLENRIDELMEVELTLKEQSPLQAYYYAEGTTAVAPHTSPSTLEIEGPDELDRLAEAIRGGAK